MHPPCLPFSSIAPLLPIATHRVRLAAVSGLLAVAVLAPGTPQAQISAATPAATSASAVAVGEEARARCERAVRQALAPNPRVAAEVRLSTSVPVPSNGSQVLLQGEGQWRDAAVPRKFTYSCNLDPQGGDAVGVVIRQEQPQAVVAPRPIEPDLSHLSPAACESSAAAAVMRRWPLASKIAFDTATRSLSQQSASRAELQGQGRAQPLPESPALVHFGFSCTIDPRDGRVVGMRLSG